jgi:SAM-dependent methyltransferase
MDTREHWESVYGRKAADAVSWYASHLRESLRYLERTGVGRDASIVDVGGGESTLVDDLLGAGYRDISVLDLSATAIAVCRARLGARSADVRWIAGDVLQHDFAPQSVDVWHDRAVFHFLTADAQRQAYVRQVLRALRPGGFAIVATFGQHGPEQCSGLPVMRYSPEELHDVFGSPFVLVDHSQELHTTPWGSTQEFSYCFCRRAP